MKKATTHDRIRLRREAGAKTDAALVGEYGAALEAAFKEDFEEGEDGPAFAWLEAIDNEMAARGLAAFGGEAAEGEASPAA